MAIKAILFDLDDTLIPSTVAYAAALKAVGLTESAARFVRAKRAVKARLGDRHPSSHNRVLYFKEMLEAGDAFSSERVLNLVDRYEAALVRRLRKDWDASRLAALLASLSRRYRLAIVSNETTRTQLLKLRVIDPRGRFFRTVVTSEEMGVEKPDLRIFREAFRRLRVTPRECLMVGDSQTADIRPMRRLGAAVFAVERVSDLWKLKEFLNERDR